MRISWPRFPAWELRCKCSFEDCPRHGMNPVTMERVVKMRLDSGLVMPLNSAYRCPRYNRVVSDTGLTGPHVTGQAIDVRIFGDRAFELLALALDYGFTGIGVQQDGAHGNRFLHLDDLPGDVVHPVTGITYPRPWIWSY